MSTELATINNEVATKQDGEALKEFRIRIENFLSKLNQEPPVESVGATPDGKANTILISHIQTTLDEFFFGLWSTDDFKWERIGNEIVGSIVLEVVHPVTGATIRRTGAAAIQIMTDAVPDEIRADKKAKNAWQLDMANKKPNSLDMGFPKLKAECEKNAANTLGRLFGRDINRELHKQDRYQPLVKSQMAREAERAAKDLADKLTNKPNN